MSFTLWSRDNERKQIWSQNNCMARADQSHHQTTRKGAQVIKNYHFFFHG